MQTKKRFNKRRVKKLLGRMANKVNQLRAISRRVQAEVLESLESKEK